MSDLLANPSKAYSFHPSRLGYICKNVEPLNILDSLDTARSLFESDPELTSIPLEDNGGVIGLVAREMVLRKSDSALEVFRNRSLEKYVQPGTVILDAMESVERALSQLFEQSIERISQDFLIYHKGRFLGIGTFLDLTRHDALLRDQDYIRAQSIQEFLMNKQETNLPKFTVHRYLKMVHGLGGDFYQNLRLRTELYMAACFDVSGKGISAAIITGMLSAFFSTLETSGLASTIAPSELVKMLNDLLQKSTPEGIFVAAGFVFLDEKSQTLSVFNCALGPVMVFSTEEGGKDVCKVIQPGLPPLGIDTYEDIERKKKDIPVKSRMRIFMYTDGLTDARNESGEMYGEEAMRNFLLPRYKVAGPLLLAELEKEMANFMGKAPQVDDITAVLIQI